MISRFRFSGTARDDHGNARAQEIAQDGRTREERRRLAGAASAPSRKAKKSARALAAAPGVESQSE